MIKKIKYLVSFFCLSGSLVLCLSCNKSTPTADVSQKYFFKQYPEKGMQLGTFAHVAADKGIFMVGATDTIGNGVYFTTISKTDAFGNLLWEKVMSGKDTYSGAWTLNLSDSNYLIVEEEGILQIIDGNGNIVLGAMNYFTNGSSPEFPIEVNHKYYLGFSKGGQGNYDENWIATVNNKGVKSYIKITEASFGHHILRLAVYNAQVISVTQTRYWICGSTFYPNSWSWSTKKKFYIARYLNNVLEASSILNATNDSFGQANLNAYLTTPDSGLVAVVSDQLNSPEITLLNYDKNLNLLWNKQLNLNGFFTLINKMIICRDGGILMVGSNFINSIFEQPVILKTDEHGNLLWYKIFRTVNNGSAQWLEELTDGSILITGYTNSFGKGNHNNDVFLIKTDANGNIK